MGFSDYEMRMLKIEEKRNDILKSINDTLVAIYNQNKSEENDIPESDAFLSSFRVCPYFKCSDSGLLCRQASICEKPCDMVLQDMKAANKYDVSICGSCTNKKCSLQSGVKRTHCDMYKSEREDEQ